MMSLQRCVIILALVTAPVSRAFSISNMASSRVSSTTRLSSSSSSSSSRADFLQQLIVTTAGAMVWAVASPVEPAHAAKYGGFGAGSPEVLDPTEAIVDRQLLQSDAVQRALANTKRYQAAVQSLQSALVQQPQADVGPFVRKELDFVQLRADLNTLNSVFDEDTQRGTDRIIRIIMQDITELQVANQQKAGVPRSERRLEIVQGKLTKLNRAFDDLLAFTK